MKVIISRCLLAFLYTLSTACIHTHSRETKDVQATPESGLSKVQGPAQSEMSYLVYRSSQLPLGTFFYHLRKGDYEKAFRKIDLKYKPANFQDEALSELIHAGFVPVYVKIKNAGSAPLEFDEKSFLLFNGGAPLKAFYSEQLPREFRHVSPQAVAANVYNTGVVVVGFAAVLGVFLLLGSHGGSPNLGGIGPINPDTEMYNDIENEVRVDYRNYLIRKTKLASGEETKGLLFFNIGSDPLSAEAHLDFNLTPKQDPVTQH